jgi:hypothetical protein
MPLKAAVSLEDSWKALRGEYVERLGRSCLAVRDGSDLAEPRQIWALLLMT